jgi:hypothetical protein
MSDKFTIRHSEPVYSSRPVKPATMDARASEPWNSWAISLVRNEIQAHEKALLRGVREAVDELIEKKVRALEIEIGQLRADATIERAHKVIDIPDFRKRRA